MQTFEPILILGGGATGAGLALAFHDAGLQVAGLWNRTPARLEALKPILPATIPVFSKTTTPAFEQALEKSRIVLIAVSDSAIPMICQMLAASPSLHRGPQKIIAHTAGCLPASLLAACAPQALGAMHPLVALPDAESARRALPHAVFAIEGDAATYAQLATLCQTLGGRPFHINPESRALYHGAAVMASNLVIALLDVAVGEAERAGLGNAEQPLLELAIGALQQAQKKGITHALTGPVIRGDRETVAKHIAHLSEEARRIYQNLSWRAQHIAMRRGPDAHVEPDLQTLLKQPEPSEITPHTHP